MVFEYELRMWKSSYGFIFLFQLSLPGERKGFLIKIKINKQTPVISEGGQAVHKEVWFWLRRLDVLCVLCSVAIV